MYIENLAESLIPSEDSTHRPQYPDSCVQTGAMAVSQSGFQEGLAKTVTVNMAVEGKPRLQKVGKGI